MSQDIAIQFARRMIQNRDVKAIQFSNGDYVPDFRMKDTQPEHGGSPETSRHGLGFTLESLEKHLSGQETYGHYLMDQEGMCRMFAFDIDLADEGTWVHHPQPPFNPEMTEAEFLAESKIFEHVNPRQLWLDRNPATAIPAAREWYKAQMMDLARRFTRTLVDVGIESAAAYSGSKGVHVYGFMPNSTPVPVDEVRAVADYVMGLHTDFEQYKGEHFYRHKSLDPMTGYRNFSIEVFPKQRAQSAGGLGNLMRLPLGRNQKSDDPTFFLDLKAPNHVMRPHPNPAALLESGDPYA